MIVNGVPNKVYRQGMETRDIWEEVFRRFGKKNSTMNVTDFLPETDSLYLSISVVRETMIFMEVDRD